MRAPLASRRAKQADVLSLQVADVTGGSLNADVVDDSASEEWVHRENTAWKDWDPARMLGSVPDLHHHHVIAVPTMRQVPKHNAVDIEAELHHRSCGTGDKPIDRHSLELRGVKGACVGHQPTKTHSHSLTLGEEMEYALDGLVHGHTQEKSAIGPAQHTP